MSDIKSLQKEYETARAKLTKLAEQLKTAQAVKFQGLPEQVGLGTVDALIKALIPYASGFTKGRLKSVYGGTTQEAGNTSQEAGSSAPSAPRARRGKRRRARLDDSSKEKIVLALKEGGKTAAVIAKEFGVSVATINIAKAKAGLTKKRKK